VGHLVEQGIGVYLMDHHSTDGTLAAVEGYRGQGLVGIERFPEDGGGPPEAADRFAWEEILRRKELLAHELDAGWVMHHDADEFRESPWAGVSLLDAVRRVDALGYNAVDFELLNFWPTHDGFRPGDDVRAAFPFFERAASWDRSQVKCWKRTGVQVDLVGSGGHDAVFPGRRVFPLRFLLRHYPIRSQAHGERKVFRERRPRRVPSEHGRRWHVQYDGLGEGDSFIRDPATLTPYDPEALRLDLALRHRGVEALEAALAERQAQVEALDADSKALRARLEELYASRSWRWTAPLRAIGRRVLGG
jgi:hypothetical protein